MPAAHIGGCIRVGSFERCGGGLERRVCILRGGKSIFTRDRSQGIAEIIRCGDYRIVCSEQRRTVSVIERTQYQLAFALDKLPNKLLRHTARRADLDLAVARDTYTDILHRLIGIYEPIAQRLFAVLRTRRARHISAALKAHIRFLHIRYRRRGSYSLFFFSYFRCIR